jgi:hypothetical protein
MCVWFVYARVLVYCAFDFCLLLGMFFVKNANIFLCSRFREGGS